MEEIDYVDFKNIDGCKDSISFLLCNSIRAKINFYVNKENIGYITFELHNLKASIGIIFINEAFRLLGYSPLIIDIFLQFIRSRGINELWTETTTELGKQRGLLSIGQKAQTYGINYISGIQTC